MLIDICLYEVVDVCSQFQLHAYPHHVELSGFEWKQLNLVGMMRIMIVQSSTVVCRQYVWLQEAVSAAWVDQWGLCRIMKVIITTGRSSKRTRWNLDRQRNRCNPISSCFAFDSSVARVLCVAIRAW